MSIIAWMSDIYDVTEVPELSKSKQHDIEVVVDRIVIKEGCAATSLTQSKLLCELLRVCGY